MAKSLQIVIVVAAIVSVCTAITDEQKQKAIVHAEPCIAQTGVRREDALKFLAGDLSVTGENIECFAKCFLEAIRFLNAEGELLEEYVIERLSVSGEKDKVEALINTCRLRTGTTPCETAYKIYRCYAEHKAI